MAVQLFLPLRHLLYPGDHRWTGQGYRFAWNVLLTEKAGSVTFLVTDPDTGRRWVADATSMYTPTQLRAMSTEPDLIHQAALAIAADEGGDVEVRADAWVSLNGRKAERLIDPTVDLASQPRDPWSDAWILPGRVGQERNDAAAGTPDVTRYGSGVSVAQQARRWVPLCVARGDEFRMRNLIASGVAGPDLLTSPGW